MVDPEGMYTSWDLLGKVESDKPSPYRNLSASSKGWNGIFHLILIGGWTNPFEKYKSTGIISRNRGKNNKMFETAT